MRRSKDIFQQNRRTKRLLKHFQDSPAFRPEAVQSLAAGTPAPDASPLEQVAVITLLCATKPFDDVLARLSSQPLQGSGESLGAAFFGALQQAVPDLERDGLEHSATDLLRVGEFLAELHQQGALAAEFRQQRHAKTLNRLRGMPFLRQRGR